MAILGINLDYTELVSAPRFDDIGSERVKSGRPRTVIVNERYFDGVLGEEQAYWLGFLYADGNVIWKSQDGRSRWAVTIGLQHGDLDHLHALQRVLGGTVSVGKQAAIFAAYSRYLCARLGSLGIVPRKSTHPCMPPTFEGAALRGFLRGLFDGDGCLHVSKRGHLQAAFCGHPGLVRWFVEMVGVEGSQRKRNNTLYYQWTGGRQARKIVRALYPGIPSLARKAAIADVWGL